MKGAGVVQFASEPAVVANNTDDYDVRTNDAPNIETQHIDHMAAEGVRFTSFYAAPFCGPSRAQIMTGCYATRVNHARNQYPN